MSFATLIINLPKHPSPTTLSTIESTLHTITSPKFWDYKIQLLTSSDFGDQLFTHIWVCHIFCQTTYHTITPFPSTSPMDIPPCNNIDKHLNTFPTPDYPPIISTTPISNQTTHNLPQQLRPSFISTKPTTFHHTCYNPEYPIHSHTTLLSPTQFTFLTLTQQKQPSSGNYSFKNGYVSLIFPTTANSQFINFPTTTYAPHNYTSQYPLSQGKQLLTI